MEAKKLKFYTSVFDRCDRNEKKRYLSNTNNHYIWKVEICVTVWCNEIKCSYKLQMVDKFSIDYTFSVFYFYFEMYKFQSISFSIKTI